jgi:hypothetical protein
MAGKVGSLAAVAVIHVDLLQGGAQVFPVVILWLVGVGGAAGSKGAIMPYKYQ